MTPAGDRETEPPGVAFPAVSGRRSSTAVGRQVVAAAVAGVDPGLAATASGTTDWRRGYVDAVRRLTATTAADPRAAVRVARQGLTAARQRCVLRGDGPDVALPEAVADAAPGPLRTVTLAGTAPEPPSALRLPYRGHWLQGQELVATASSWAAAGVVEPSVAAAVQRLVERPQWLDLRGTTVVLLGAGAELGPLVPLLRWGAHVVAVDLPGPPLWRRCVDHAIRGAGSMSLPVREPLPAGAGVDRVAGAAGADLLAEPAALAGWVRERVAGAAGPVVLGVHVYADGARHALATLAADAVVGAAAAGATTRPALALLATPTDAFVVPERVVSDSLARHAGGAPRVRALQRAVRLASGGRLFAPNYRGLLDGGRRGDGSPRLVGLHDALVPQQGPGYALAKRLQRWQATTWRADGGRVSVNVAPATRTRSVLRNRALAAAYAGAHRFGVEVFDPATSATLMAALLVHDLRDPTSPADPAVHLDHPDDLLWHGAAHGGLWRTPWAPRSVLGLAVGLGALPRGR